MANGDLDRINALSGGAPLPQADTMTLARRLLGPALADRYGDVIGARPTNIGDVARDFAVGFVSGNPAKADELKFRVIESYRSELEREQNATRQREADARQQLSAFFDLLDQGKRVPKDLRQDFFKEALPKIGVEPSSPMFMKILTNYEKFGDVYDALGDPEIRRLADEDPLGAVEQLINMGHDGAAALKVAQSVQQMKQYRAQTQAILSRSKGIEQRAAGARTKARDRFIERMAGRTVREGLGGRRVRQLTPEEILAMADRFFPETGEPAPAGIAQEKPAAPPPVAAPAAPGAPPAPGAAAGAVVGSQLAEPVGIPQAAPVSAEAGKQKVRRITGTVTRAE